MLDLCPEILTITDIQQVLQIGRTKAYFLVKSGQIRSIRVGNSIRVPKNCIIDYVMALGYNAPKVVSAPIKEV